MLARRYCQVIASLVVDWSISAGNILTIAVAVVGFIGAAIVNAIAIGRYIGAVDKRLDSIDKRMGAMEEAEKDITKTMIAIAEQRAEISTLNKRVDDVQKYGSHRLAEVLEAMRGQIMADFRERFDFLQRQIGKDER